MSVFVENSIVSDSKQEQGLGVVVKQGYVNLPPRKLPQGAPRDAVKTDFANRLQKAIADKGWNQSDLARRASAYLPRGKSLGRDMVSHYVRAVALPRQAQIVAMAKALGVSPRDLLPNAPAAADKVPALDVKQLADGNVWLRINQAVDWPRALRILQILNPEGDHARLNADK
jgi:transcriptional regulator with XRE-family HTH domain